MVRKGSGIFIAEGRMFLWQLSMLFSLKHFQIGHDSESFDIRIWLFSLVFCKSFMMQKKTHALCQNCSVS